MEAWQKLAERPETAEGRLGEAQRRKATPGVPRLRTEEEIQQYREVQVDQEGAEHCAVALQRVATKI